MPVPQTRSQALRALIVASAGVIALLATTQQASAQQNVSSPVIFQWFEASWKTMERRMPDIHAAGYGALWTPPPGRALNTQAGGGIGYDIYDRFDLGKARDTTLYGTEQGYRRVVKEAQKMGGSVYVDYVHHHVGSFDLFPGNNPGPYIQNRFDYPGFNVSTPGTQDGDTYRDPPPTSGGDPAFEYQYRLARLLTLNFTASNSLQYTRNPVPGASNNIPAAAGAWAIATATTNSAGAAVSSTIPRQANVASNDNRRFYPDLNGPSRTVVDNGVPYTVFDYNTSNPSAGDPVQEGVTGYVMRYAQWLIQDIGLDGLRVDAARHVPLGAGGDSQNPTQVDVPRLIDRAVAGASNRFNLDGTRRSVFQFQEVFNGDPNFLQTFVRKGAAPGDTTQPNRDVLDFPMWFAMRSNLTANDGQNNWYNMRNASQDNRDDGLAHNGSQSIGFVVNHDEGGVHLSNVAHAWMLMRPGNAYVYMRGAEFDRTGNNSFFLKDGRGDSLGGLYGNLVTKLVEIRNAYGRGNFRERWIDGGGVSGDSKIYVFERTGAAIVGLSAFNNGTGVTSFDERTNVYVSHADGTRLIELTGNAADPAVDPLGQIPETVRVFNTDNVTLGAGRINLRIPRNQNVNGVTHGKGYVIYGLPRPVGTLTLSNVASTLAGETPTDNRTNTTARLSSIDVVSSDSFNVTLNTQVVTFADAPGTGQPTFTDHRAAGNVALLKFNDGIDLNGNGVVDFTNTSVTEAYRYGFENFVTTSTPGYISPTASQAGVYTQTINATGLNEGYHYLTVRAYRADGVGESKVFTEFRRTIYVDRLAPQSTLAGFGAFGPNSTRDFQVRSTDLTADSVHVLLNLGAALTDTEILGLVGGGNKAEQIDRDLFSLVRSNVISGNHVATVVTFEVTGRYSILRLAGLSITNALGAGLGDLDGNGLLQVPDILSFESVYLSNNAIFNAAADMNGDGLVSRSDLRGLEFQLRTKGADAATWAEYYRVFNVSFQIPEPASLSLLAIAGLALGRKRR
jgi:alpha-amylase